MKISTVAIREGYDGKTCLVHARMCVMPDGKRVATAQDLDVFGMDLFGGIKLSVDYGDFVAQEGLLPIANPDGTVSVGCDGTPMYHEKSGKVILLGHRAVYMPDGKAPVKEYLPATFYSVFDGEKFSKMRFVEMPEGLACGNGCGQSVEDEDGTILIPVYMKTERGYYGSAVMRCAFDGENLTFLEMGNVLRLEVERGLYEPSIVRFGGMYHMTLRNDLGGYHAVSRDGLHFEEAELWRFEDGEILGNYNTQQHWLVCDGKLYLVYTARGHDNDHVFRHRAPLLMAEVRGGRLVRESECIVVPERGARLGNFGVCQVSQDHAIIMAAEWMQPRGCEKYGSNNAIWVTDVRA